MKGNHTKKVKHINNKTLIVTLDIGKTVHYGYMRTPTGAEVKSCTVYKARKWVNVLLDKGLQFKRAQGL